MVMKRTGEPWMDAAETLARKHGHIVPAGSIDKPHGLRGCVIVGPGGCAFVPGLAIGCRETGA